MNNRPKYLAAARDANRSYGVSGDSSVCGGSSLQVFGMRAVVASRSRCFAHK